MIRKSYNSKIFIRRVTFFTTLAYIIPSSPILESKISIDFQYFNARLEYFFHIGIQIAK